MPAPSTLTVKVVHGRECDRKDDKSRKCKCRKQLYIYENGKDRTESAKTRSWEQAETRAREKMGEYDPVTIQARKLESERSRLLAVEEQKRAEAQARRTPITTTLDQWRAGLKPKSHASVVQFNAFVGKVKSWAQENNLTFLDEITPALLYAWQGKWSKDADIPRDQMGINTQNLYITVLHRFFKWTLMVDYLVKDPSVIVKRQKFERVQTCPLSSDAQFREILSATYRMDEERYTRRDTPMYGRDLRAIFLLQRWTGIRIIDALMLQHNAIHVCPVTGKTLMTLVTKKTGKLIKDRPLPMEVVEALKAIPRRQEHVRSGHYFWSNDTDVKNLTKMWGRRICDDLNPLLSLTDEDGQPMRFRSHMLRDTFAVELLLQGVEIKEVSKLLTHDSVQMTEMYYDPWVKKRREMLHDTMVAAMERMGAVFTPASVPLPTAQPRLM